MRTDGQTGTTNVIVVFHDVANASKNESSPQDCFQDCGEKKIARRRTWGFRDVANASKKRVKSSGLFPRLRRKEDRAQTDMAREKNRN